MLGVENTVACKIRFPYSAWEGDFVRFACSHAFAIVSGFALGADSIGHDTAWKTDGKTICVMPGGLDLCRFSGNPPCGQRQIPHPNQDEDYGGFIRRIVPGSEVGQPRAAIPG